MKINKILDALNITYPDARCMLDYKKDYELVIAVMLSSQTTDVSVNKVTPKLFSTFNDLNKLKNASYEEVHSIIKKLGLANKKAANVINIAKIIAEEFEYKVPKRSGGNGYIDMLWKGNILIEMKSRGKDLDKAYQQASEYFDGLKEYDLPKYILVCDFQRFRLEDVDNGKVYEFMLDELYKKVERLAPEIIAEERHIYKGVSANIDFYSGFVYDMLDLPKELYTPIFAISRIAGWSAHRMEEIINNGKIIRPAYINVHEELPYLKMEERD
mgnify:CR=1 FL=1